MINEKMRELGAKRSVIRELFEYGKKRKAEIGEDNVFDFSLGNPSIPAPKEVNDGIRQILDKENSVLLHGYTSAEGDIAVREDIACYINSTYGENVTADCLYMTVGAAAAITISLNALVTEGEEVICVAPYFPEYKVFIEKAGGKLVIAKALENTFLPNIEEIKKCINQNTKAIIINYPNNPTGVMIDKNTLIELCNLLSEKEK